MTGHADILPLEAYAQLLRALWACPLPFVCLVSLCESEMQFDALAQQRTLDEVLDESFA
jgi:hypothetical protein